MPTFDQLKERQSWDLEKKIVWSSRKILEFYYHCNGNVHYTFSGGKDSQVLGHLIRSLIPHVPGVFCDTGLEFSEIRSHVKRFGDIVWLKPERKWKDVIREEGVAYPSKKNAKMIRVVRNPTGKNDQQIKCYLEGVKSDGTKAKSFVIPKKYRYLLDSPFPISEKCCDVFKKDPWKKYEKETGSRPFNGTMASESVDRRVGYLSTGCNSFKKGAEMSKPLSIWTEKDIWNYAEMNGIRFCDLYYDREYKIEWKGEALDIVIPGEERTGCTFCLFGINQEKGMNRFQRLWIIDNRKWKFLVENVGFGEILDFIGIPYLPTDKQIYSLVKGNRKYGQISIFGQK